MNNPVRLTPAELAHVLPLLLAPAGGSLAAGRELVPSFAAYMEQSVPEWVGWRTGAATRPRALLLTLLMPGRTALAVLPSPDAHGIDKAAQSHLMQVGVAALADRGLHYAQALVEPNADAKRMLLTRVGFTRLAPLVYLERDALYPWVNPPAPEDGEWVNFSDATCAEFEHVILATYQSSLDCPELTGIRPIEDVLAAHRAAGRFDSRLWELIRVRGDAAGCLLLAQLPQAGLLEVVYMGVLPEHRGRGVGAILLRRALEHCRATRTPRLSLVVDDRNAPAQRLYARLGLAPVTRRDAYWFRWRSSPPGKP